MYPKARYVETERRFAVVNLLRQEGNTVAGLQGENKLESIAVTRAVLLLDGIALLAVGVSSAIFTWRDKVYKGAKVVVLDLDQILDGPTENLELDAIEMHVNCQSVDILRCDLREDGMIHVNVHLFYGSEGLRSLRPKAGMCIPLWRIDG